jgi:cellulose synthase (UDP-forming)
VQFDTPVLEVLAPLLFVIGAIYLLGPTLPISRSWARFLVFAVVWLIVIRYLDWRFFATVVPADGRWYEVGWVWFVFAVEMLAIGDALILYLCFLRSSDRSREADWNEARLRALSPQYQPSVDVYIATYNETLEVLEKTITGALCLDYTNFSIWVLDGGRRPWLKDFCEAKGVGYITRPDNSHAKAGAINHALTNTDSDFVAVLDADFIVQRNFLMRTIGFFNDPKIGIVQAPHTFYNHDPMQTNLALRKTIPDDQRFFFEAIMPSRDAWDAAFCCGSNSVTRRAALRAIGDALPTQSITEDVLLSLTLLRAGYITRYLCERLAFGLAPEGLQAFFIQRQRWARGAMQILYLAAGPFGKNLTIMQRLLFLPTHWLTQSLTFSLAIIIPLVFLWTGVLPMVNVTLESVFYYVIPTILATVGGICIYAPNRYFPLAAQVLGTFQSFKILPGVLLTLIKPFGHSFKVTPKGSAARTESYNQEVFWIAATLMLLTAAGVVVNVIPEWRIITQSALIPVVAGWSAYNILLLFLVCMMSLQASEHRGEERFTSDEPVLIVGSDSARTQVRLKDISLSGAGILPDQGEFLGGKDGEALQVFIPEVGYIPAHIARHSGQLVGVQFDLRPSLERDLLIRKLFTSGLVATTVSASAWSATSAILESIWSTPSAVLGVDTQGETVSAPEESIKLPAETLVVPPHVRQSHWADLAKQRRAVA